MERKNCWEALKCGRESGGSNVEEHGVCTASLPNQYEGVNKGTRGGRFCWMAGTCTKGIVAGTYIQKLNNCMHCDFMKQVCAEEGRNFVLTSSGFVEKKAS